MRSPRVISAEAREERNVHLVRAQVDRMADASHRWQARPRATQADCVPAWLAVHAAAAFCFALGQYEYMVSPRSGQYPLVFCYLSSSRELDPACARVRGRAQGAGFRAAQVATYAGALASMHDAYAYASSAAHSVSKQVLPRSGSLDLLRTAVQAHPKRNACLEEQAQRAPAGLIRAP